MNQEHNKSNKQGNTQNNNLKVYTFSTPPLPNEPYLHAVRHRMIIDNFDGGGNVCCTTNSQGEVDFYVLLFPEDSFEDISRVSEHFQLNIYEKDYLEIQFLYEDEVLYTFRFHLANPMNRYVLHWLLKEKRVNMYYVNYFDGEYVCTGLKIFQLSGGFIYDLERFVTGKRPLLLPTFCESSISDGNLTKERLLKKGWGFYLDYRAMLERVGNVEDTEEIILRYLLDATTCLQQSRYSGIKNGFLIMWIGRRIGVSEDNQPLEYYCVYLSGDKVNNTDYNSAKLIMEKALGELPELRQTLWVSPLAEEGIPVAAIKDNRVYKFNLTNDFYYLSAQLFKEHYHTQKNYTSYYHKIANYHNQVLPKNNVCSLVKKRKAKGIISENNLTVVELMNLVKWGDEEDLSLIFDNMGILGSKMLDEAIYILSQRYKLLLESYLLSLSENSSEILRGVAMIGLGLIKSTRGIPIIVEKLQGSPEEAADAFDALLIIGDSVIPDLIPLLKNKKANVRLRVVKTLGSIGSAQALAALKGMGSDPSVRVEKAKQRFLNN